MSGRQIVVYGAQLKCTGCPGGKSFLLPTTAPTVVVENKYPATIKDHKSGDNVPAFDKECLFTGGVCKPDLPAPWQDNIFGGLSMAPSLSQDLDISDQLMCAEGGTITVVYSCQSTVFVGYAPSSSDDDEGFLKKGFNFLIGDDINSILHPKSPLDFAGGVLGVTPIGKAKLLYKGGRAGLKEVGEKGVKETGEEAAERAAKRKALREGDYPTKYHRRTPEEVRRLRGEFERDVKPNYIRQYATSSPDAMRRFTPEQRAKMIATGRMPKGTNWVVHHKKPLFRGGTNDFSNLRVMNGNFHRRANKHLHYYPEGRNPYGAN